MNTTLIAEYGDVACSLTIGMLNALEWNKFWSKAEMGFVIDAVTLPRLTEWLESIFPVFRKPRMEWLVRAACVEIERDFSGAWLDEGQPRAAWKILTGEMRIEELDPDLEFAFLWWLCKNADGEIRFS